MSFINRFINLNILVNRIKAHVWRVFSFFLIALAGALATYTIVLALAVIAPTKVDFLNDLDADNKADPGETIDYTVVIPNSGPDPAASVTFTDTIDSNTTLVGGSLAASPVGVNDTYPQTVIGNMSINSANIPYSVTTNDFLGLNPTATISAFDSTTTQGGQVTMITSGAGIGQFTYDPPPGFEGTDTFTYTLTDNANATSAAANRTATISIPVSGIVWFINNGAPSCVVAGCGRLSNPFSTLVAFNTLNDNGGGNHPGNSDNIFIYESAVGYSGTVTLLNGQKLIGQDATASLATITGLTPPTGSASFPTMNSGNGTVTSLASTVTLNTNATVRGLSINSTASTGMNDPAGAITGVTVSEVNVTTTTGTGVNFSSTAGSLSFTGLATTGGAGANLVSNTGGTFTFTGMAVSSGANTAFNATGGGTINVCDENPCNPAVTGALVNTLTTTTGTALNVANTTISANNMEFRSINVDGNDTAPTNGIVLNNTGSAGGLIVKGTGSAASGGTVQDASGDGISLTSTAMVSLSYMNITSNLDNGIGGSSINGFVLNNVSITSNGDNAATDDSGVDLVDLSGSAIGGANPTSITNSTISNNHEFELQITNSSGTLTDFQMSGNVISSNGLSGAHGNLVNFLALGSATMRMTTTSGTFTGSAPNTATGIQCDHSGTSGTVRCNVSGASFTNNNVAVSVSQANGGNLKFIVDNNTATGNRSQGLNLFVAATGTGTVDGNFTNNIVGTLGTAGSGSSLGFGIRVQNEGVSTGRSVNVLISGNTVQETASFSLININQGIAGQTSSTATNATITGNTLRNSAARAIVVQQNNATDADSAGTTCVDVSANVMSGIPGQVGDGTSIRLRRLDANSGGGDTFRVRQTSFADFAAQNSITTAQIAIGGTMTYNGGACTVPNTAMSPSNSHTVAQTQPEANPMVGGKAQSLNSVNAFAATSSFVKLSKQASGINSHTELVTASTNDGGKPLFSVSQLAPALSGETINVIIGTLPAGKSVTIKYQVTVNNPVTPGTTQISNQGTVSGSNFSNILTDDPSVGGSSDPTITLVDRPDTTVSSISRVGSTPTNSNPVSWTVTFANAISNLTGSNFTLVSGGLGGAPAITGVTAVGGPPATQWTVTASTGTGAGTLGLNLVNDTSLSHDVTNLTFTGEVFNIDHIAPNTTSFTRQNPLTSSTNADVLVFRVTFNEAVASVDTTDFSVNGTTIAIVTNVTPFSSSVFDVTVSGGDLATYNGVVGLNFSGALDITDLAGNAVVNTDPSTDETYTVDNSVPGVTINQAIGQTDPTGSSPINFTVVFDETVSDFDDAADIDLSASTAPGTLSAVITGGPTTYNVAVSGMTGNGTIISSVPAGAATDAAANLSAASTSADNTVTYDASAPTVTINQALGQSDPTGSSPVNFTVVFSETVTEFNDATDIDLSASTAPGILNAVITGGPTTYNVEVSGMTGNGTIIASVPAGAATDAAANLSAASTSTDNTVTYDASPPTVTINQAIGQSDPTGVTPINFTVVFSKPVAGFDNTADVDLSASTTPGTLDAVITGGPTTYNVEVSGMTGDGTVIASIPVGVAQDAATNLNTASTSTDNTVLYDTAPPSVTINQAVGQTDPTNASPINFIVVFSEAVTDFDDAADVALSGAAGATTSLITGGPATYNVAVSGMSSSGTVIASIPAGAAIDVASNLNNASTSTDNTVAYDNAAPTVNTFTASSPSTSLNIPITAFTASDNVAVTGYLITELATPPLAGAVGWTGAAPTTYTVAIDGSYTLYPWAKDLAGNVSSVFSSPLNINVDSTAPDTTIGAAPTDPTKDTTANFTFSGTDNITVPASLTFECRLDAALFGAVACTDLVDPFGTQYNGLADGSHTFQVRALDTVGNVDATPASFTWTVDTARPSVVVSSITTSPTNISPISVTITFSEPVTGFTPSVASGDIVIGGVGGVDSNPAGSGTTYTFNLTPSGNGVVTVQVPDGSSQDTASNWNTVSNTFSITYDSVNPTVTIDQAADQTDPTSISPVNFTVVFSELVTGFATGDVDISGTAGATTGIVTEIAPNDGTTYKVAASGMTASGTVIASIPVSIAQDLAANDNDASTSTDNTVTFNYDSTLPIVVSSLRADPSPTNLASVHFTVTFSEDVTGVDIGDFDLTTASVVSGAAVSGASGSGSVYTITVNTGSGNGTIRLNVINNGSIQDASLNSLGADFTSGEVYSVIKLATFADVPLSYWANSYIERLYMAGVTYGCSTSPLIYCPNGPVTRAQLAILLLRGMHGAVYTPPSVGSSTGFNDVATTHWAAAWIKQLAAEGITAGCGGGNYCPEAPASRAQVAVLLVRAVHGISYIPPTATGIFADVPVGSFGADYIEQLVTDGITGGCSAGNYCPGTLVNRDQMAVFLVRAFNLP